MAANIIANVSNIIVRDDGVEYRSIRSLANLLNICKDNIRRSFKKKGKFIYQGHSYYLKAQSSEPNTQTTPCLSEDEYAEYQEFRASKEISSLPFEKYNFNVKTHKGGNKYAIALFSDVHIEETVDPATVLGMNEYNIDIAKQRITNYFVNLVKCLEKDKPESLIFACLGDVISGYIHDELAQTNELSPLEAIEFAQSIIYNGLKYIVDNSSVKKIDFIGIVGNHSRTTKKIQHSNGYKMSYEWLMFRNIERECKLTNLPINFNIPNSEVAVVYTNDDKRYLFAHGFQIKSSGNGTVCGIYPSLNRLSMKWAKNFHQDKIFIGHFHSCISLPNAVVNGSIIGFNTFSLTNGFEYEEPAQMYELYDTEIGLINTRKIYCK